MQSSRFVWLCKSKIGLNHNIMTKTLTTLLKIIVFTHFKCLNVSTFHWSYNYHKMITIMILPMCAQGQNSGKFQAKFSQIVTFCTFIGVVHKKYLDNVTFRNQPRNSLRGEEKKILKKKNFQIYFF